jgi:hypothetical protein
MTVTILIVAVFVLGFFADPIINLYLDPWSFLSPWSRPDPRYYYPDDDRSSWYEHFAKGFASMGVLGFLKVLVASPLSYFRMGGGRGRNTGRDRYEQVSWIIILIGTAPCARLPCGTNISRPPTKESEHGAAVRSKGLESESWTYKVRTTMTRTSNIASAQSMYEYELDPLHPFSYGSLHLRICYGLHSRRPSPTAHL